MLKKIHIENFKSLKDVTLNLQRVNLLIGPNNSGKSNLLKAIVFYQSNKQFDFSATAFLKKAETIRIEMWHQLEQRISDYPFGINIKEFLRDKPVSIFSYLSREEAANVKEQVGAASFPYLLNDTIYRPNPNTFTDSYHLSNDESVNEDCSNLVPFLFNLGQNHRKLFQQIENGLKTCVGDLVGISTPAVDVAGVSKLRLKFFDKNENDFWADEVSEGVLYFLALLCIVHQPNPPKLLLLEEPERGIHPRRIQEIMDFIFQLADEKNIQVILTTHHERVVDYFADIPESVFIFDKDNEGATQVKNLLKDVIEPSDAAHEKDGLPKIQFTASLGEHWAAGFMGGVPK